MSNFIVAIDGPSASGSPRSAGGLRRRLGLVHVDSGSFYRGSPGRCSRLGACPGAAVVVQVMNSMDLRVFLDGASVRFNIDGEDPGEAIRSAAVQGKR